MVGESSLRTLRRRTLAKATLWVKAQHEGALPPPCHYKLTCRVEVLESFNHLYRRRQWQPTPVLLPGKSHGQRSLVGYSSWGHKESDIRWIIEKAREFHTPAACSFPGENARSWEALGELWCWRRLLRVPWTAERSNQSILREINPEYSPSRGTPRVSAPLHLSPFSSPDRDRRVDSPALSGRGPGLPGAPQDERRPPTKTSRVLLQRVSRP